jgi:hypothetical protein
VVRGHLRLVRETIGLRRRADLLDEPVKASVGDGQPARRLV